MIRPPQAQLQAGVFFDTERDNGGQPDRITGCNPIPFLTNLLVI